MAQVAPKNERITENLVRTRLHAVGLTDANGFVVEEQMPILGLIVS